MATEFHPSNWVDENGIKWKYTRCFFCRMNCGLEVGVDTKTGRIVEIKGNQKEGTVLCDRMGKHGEKAIQFHYHPKRVNHALKRIGEKGEDKWEEIPYEQALYPGTDAALILGWANYILENELYNEDFLKYWSNAVFLVRKDNGQMIRADTKTSAKTAIPPNLHRRQSRVRYNSPKQMIRSKKHYEKGMLI